MQSRKPNHHKNQQKSVKKSNKVQWETDDECEHVECLEQRQTDVKAAPALFFNAMHSFWEAIVMDDRHCS